MLPMFKAPLNLMSTPRCSVSNGMCLLINFISQLATTPYQLCNEKNCCLMIKRSKTFQCHGSECFVNLKDHLSSIFWAGNHHQQTDHRAAVVKDG